MPAFFYTCLWLPLLVIGHAIAGSSHFPPLRNDRLFRAIKGEHVDRAPVWIVRQASRYLPEFVDIRAQHDFFELAKTPALSAEVTAQPIAHYPGLLDAAIQFGDIVFIPQALGMALEINLAPYFPDPLKTPADVAKLNFSADIAAELRFMLDGLAQSRHQLHGDAPVIGFIGAPWTLLVLMTGGGSKNQTVAQSWLVSYPKETKDFLRRLAALLVDFAVAQVKAGAQYIDVFDSFAGSLSPDALHEFEVPVLRRIAEDTHDRLRRARLPEVPLSLYAKGASYALAELATLGYDVISLDANVDLAQARRTTRGKVTLHGNVDPNVLFQGRDAIEQEVKRVVASARASGGNSRWIASLGDGVPDGADAEAVGWLLECLRRYTGSAHP